jgi:hypothetical protein
MLTYLKKLFGYRTLLDLTPAEREYVITLSTAVTKVR